MIRRIFVVLILLIAAVLFLSTDGISVKAQSGGITTLVSVTSNDMQARGNSSPYAVKSNPLPLLPWGMFQGDLQHTGRSAYIGPQQKPKVQWDFHIAAAPGAPAIGSDGTIYLPAGMLNVDNIGYLYAINPNGTQKWRVQLNGLPSFTTPAIGPDGTVYVHCNGDEGNIVAIEKLYAVTPDGVIKWIFKPNDDLGMVTAYVQSSPAVASDGTIYVGSMNTYLFALNPDGTIKWAHSPSTSSINASPAIAPDGTIYFVDVGFTLYAYATNGTLKWSYDLAGPGHAGTNDQSPSIGPDGTVYITSPYDNNLYAISPNGTLRWHFPGGGSLDDWSTPGIGSDGTIYWDGDDGLYALNANGTLKWKYAMYTTYGRSSPVIAAGGTSYWFNGYLALSTNGTLKWSGVGGSWFAPALFASTPLGSDGTLYSGHFASSSQPYNGLTAYRSAQQIFLPLILRNY